jgi:hypothetical protein
MTTLRDKLRAKTIGAKKHFKRVSLDYEGETFEFLEPSVAQRRDIMKRLRGSKGEIDDIEFMVEAIILTCVEPNTEIKVFESTDFDGFMASPSGSFITAFGTKAVEALMGNIDLEEVGKKVDSSVTS